MSDSQDKVLSYATRQKPHLSRQAKHLILIVVALVIAAILVPRVYRQLHRKWLAHRIANYAMPNTNPVIDEVYDPPPTIFAVGESPIPQDFGQILPATGSTLFIGELVDKSNIPRLVRIGVSVPSNVPGTVMLSAGSIPRTKLNEQWTATSPFTFDDASLREPPTSVKLFAGQRDRHDSSHITIRYVLNEKESIIDGYLNDDGTMTLELRDPPATTP